VEHPTPPAARHDLVVIGASAGGVETLSRVVAGLPPDLPAAICVVLHLAPSSPSALARILERAGPLPCRSACDGDALRLGEIIVAPPDRHLVIEDGRVRLTIGPRENGHRPAVDVLFRSAATARDGRVLGVVLSGTRDDGAAGLAVIKSGGGAAVVQDPKEALYAGMPASALAHVDVDAVVPSELVADTVAAMVKGEALPPGAGSPTRFGDDPSAGSGVTTICPECGGVLTEGSQAGVPQWECRVGHRYSRDSLVDAQAQGVEAALWAAIRALEDRRILLERMADQLQSLGQHRSADSFSRRALDASDQARLVRDALAQAAATTLREFSEDDSARAVTEGGDGT
jgi:two-component system chemotaxis response regulator CheB